MRFVLIIYFEELVLNCQKLNIKWHRVSRTLWLSLGNGGKALALSLLLIQSVMAAQTVGPVSNES